MSDVMPDPDGRTAPARGLTEIDTDTEAAMEVALAASVPHTDTRPSSDSSVATADPVNTQSTSSVSPTTASASTEDAQQPHPSLLASSLTLSSTTLPSQTAQPIPTPQTSQPSSEAPTPKVRSRRSSQFQSSRPAPPSPAPSRRTSQIHSPALSSRDRASSTSSSAGHASSTFGGTGAAGSASGMSGPSPAGPASGSASSPVPPQGGSTGALTRKLSQSQNQIQPTIGAGGLGKRASIVKARPRSSLGTAMYTDADTDADADGPQRIQSHSAPSPSLGSIGVSPSIPESSSVSTGLQQDSQLASGPSLASTANTSQSPSATPSRKPSRVSLVIRDYAFPVTDERHHGRGQPVSTADSSTSRLSSFLQSANAGSGSDRRASGSGGEKKGWSFSLLGWRGFMSSGRKSRSNSQSQSEDGGGSSRAGSASGPRGRDDADSEPDYMAVGDVVTTEDDYAFESDDDEEDDEEPFGLYRAAYAFEPEGEHEIALEEGEIVEVRGRGVGEGWVVAVKLRRRSSTGAGLGTGAGAVGVGLGVGLLSPSDRPGVGLGGTGPDPNTNTNTNAGTIADKTLSAEREDTIEGLVPEGYLERVDEEEVRRGMIYAGFQGGQRRTVAPDGISEEPEETSDLESENGPGR